MSDPLTLQKAEFDALENLVHAFQACTQTAVVDDDYPRVRGRYETRLREFIDALKANGRLPISTNTEAAALLTCMDIAEFDDPANMKELKMTEPEIYALRGRLAALAGPLYVEAD